MQAGHGQGRAPAPAPEDDLGNGAKGEEFLGLGHVDEAYGHADDERRPHAFLERVARDAGQGQRGVADEHDAAVEKGARLFRGADGARASFPAGAFGHVPVCDEAVQVLPRVGGMEF